MGKTKSSMYWCRRVHAFYVYHSSEKTKRWIRFKCHINSRKIIRGISDNRGPNPSQSFSNSLLLYHVTPGLLKFFSQGMSTSSPVLHVSIPCKITSISEISDPCMRHSVSPLMKKWFSLVTLGMFLVMFYVTHWFINLSVFLISCHQIMLLRWLKKWKTIWMHLFLSMWATLSSVTDCRMIEHVTEPDDPELRFYIKCFTTYIYGQSCCYTVTLLHYTHSKA